MSYGTQGNAWTDISSVFPSGRISGRLSGSIRIWSEGDIGLAIVSSGIGTTSPSMVCEKKMRTSCVKASNIEVKFNSMVAVILLQRMSPVSALDIGLKCGCFCSLCSYVFVVRIFGCFNE